MEPNETVEPNTSLSFSGLRPTKLRAAQIRLLHAQSGIGSIGALLGAMILGGALWTVVSHERIVVWVLAYAGLFLGRYYLIHSFHSRKQDDDAVVTWGKWHTLVVNAGGLLWGVAGVWLFPQDSILHQFLLSIFVAGITAAGAVIYSPTKDYAGNILLALLPLSGRFIYEFDEFHVTIGGVILLFAGALLLTGRKMNGVYADSLRLRYDKEEFVEDLKHEIGRRDRLEVELKRARDELEVRVEERTAELKTLNRTLEQEIVERKRAEEGLRESEEKYRSLVETISDVIFQINSRGVVTYVSPVIRDVFEYEAEEVIGKTFVEFVHPEDRELLLKRFSELNVGIERPLEYRVATKSGETRWVRTHTKPTIKENTFDGAQGTLIDITDRKRTEELALQSARLRSVADLSSGVAHHFNNLLQIVIGNTSLSLADLESGHLSEIKTNLEQMLHAATRGADTVKRLQTFADMRAGVTESEGAVFDLATTAGNAAEVSQPLWKSDLEKRGIKIDLQLDLQDGCLVKGQENEMFEVLVNLIRNAAEAMPQGGDIEVKVYKEADDVVITVRDTGTGIAEQDLRKVFQPFWSSKGVGIGKGMGLAVTHGLVKRHGGNISVQSAVGKGTTFTIRLPVSQEPIRKTEEPAMIPAEGKLTILVIDDDSNIAALLERICAKAGHRVFKALAGDEGLAIFNKEPVDLVFCDLGMPGMKGWDVGKAIRSVCQEKGITKPPFILLTGWGAQEQEKEKIAESGTDAVVAKPIDSAPLLATIQEIAARFNIGARLT
jgi:PAS domain S-box-containing protein